MRRQSGSLIPEVSWSSNTEDDISQLLRHLLRALFNVPRTHSFEKQINSRRHGPLARSIRTTKAYGNHTSLQQEILHVKDGNRPSTPKEV